MSRRGALEDERGFTLVEVMVTIIMMGIVLAIASSTWFGLVDSRRVDSATNQLAADLRQAHSRATNRLAPQTVTLAAGSSEYTMAGAPRDLDDDPDEDLAVVDSDADVTFNPDGSATLPGGVPTLTRTISLATGDPTEEPNHDIQINAATSEIKVVP
jgi:prepilin-type N-terminal cleavage/methylation domain-containing protein